MEELNEIEDFEYTDDEKIKEAFLKTHSPGFLRMKPRSEGFSKQTSAGKLYEDNLPKRKLDSKTCLEMVSLGLIPSIPGQYEKYLAFKDTPELVKLWEGPEWKFTLTESQEKEILEKIEGMKGIPEEVLSMFIFDELQEYLPECKIMATDVNTRKMIDAIINDDPLYFKSNPTFKQRLEEIEKKK